MIIMSYKKKLREFEKELNSLTDEEILEKSKYYYKKASFKVAEGVLLVVVFIVLFIFMR